MAAVHVPVVVVAHLVLLFVKIKSIHAILFLAKSHLCTVHG